jgi:hypothetical protein
VKGREAIAWELPNNYIFCPHNRYNVLNYPSAPLLILLLVIIFTTLLTTYLLGNLHLSHIIDGIRLR